MARDVQYCTPRGNFVYAAHWVVRKGVPDGRKAKRSSIAVRDLAKRARRLAGVLTLADDVTRLLRYADELEAQAVELDKRAKEGG